MQQLATDCGEAPLFAGHRGDDPEHGPGPVLEIFVNPNGTSWMMIHSLPNGLSCFVADGTAWRSSGQPDAPKPGRGA